MERQMERGTEVREERQRETEGDKSERNDQLSEDG